MLLFQVNPTKIPLRFHISKCFGKYLHGAERRCRVDTGVPHQSLPHPLVTILSPKQYRSLTARFSKLVNPTTTTAWADTHHHITTVISANNIIEHFSFGHGRFGVGVHNSVALSLVLLLHSSVEVSVVVGGGVEEDFHKWMECFCVA